MNRRGFLSFLGAAAASATLDPERLLWKPGKLISIPTLQSIENSEALRRYCDWLAESEYNRYALHFQMKVDQRGARASYNGKPYAPVETRVI